jgi:hypothetical protein
MTRIGASLVTPSDVNEHEMRSNFLQDAKNLDCIRVFAHSKVFSLSVACLARNARERSGSTAEDAVSTAVKHVEKIL